MPIYSTHHLITNNFEPYHYLFFFLCEKYWSDHNKRNQIKFNCFECASTVNPSELSQSTVVVVMTTSNNNTREGAMATASDDRAAADVLKSLARHLNCLNEDNKSARRRALEAVKRETVEQRLSSAALQELFAGLLKALLKCLSDPAETCRDTAIQIITGFIRSVPKPEDSLPYLMPTLAQRLGGKEILEPAEELRLALMEMLSLLVEVCGRQLATYLDDIIKILQRTITDPFPEVKKESCKCTISFAQCVPGKWTSSTC